MSASVKVRVLVAVFSLFGSGCPAYVESDFSESSSRVCETPEGCSFVCGPLPTCFIFYDRNGAAVFHGDCKCSDDPADVKDPCRDGHIHLEER